MQVEQQILIPKNVETNDKYLSDEINNINIYKKSAPSVVNVTCLKVSQSIFGSVDEPSGGSGFIWDKQGHIVTNFHVVQATRKIYVSLFNDSMQYPAKIVGWAPRKDIAILKIEAPEDALTPISVGTSSNLMVGQKTVALGNPFGLDNTLTTGIVSALNRKIQSIGDIEIHGIIQTDASINPGNSGGPLLNSSGELIGMNTAIISQSGTSAGLGFAVPVDTVKRIVPQLIKHGKEIRPTLGLEFEHRLQLKKGLAVRAVIGRNAQKAGFKGLARDSWGRLYFGDIILKIDSHEINTPNDLYHTLDKYKIDQSVKVTIIRNNKVKVISLKLSSN